MNNPLKGKSRTVQALVIISVVLLCLAAVAVAVPYLTIPSSGTINAPASLTSDKTSINWGTINAGNITPISQQVTLQNTGQQSTSALHLSATTSVGTVTWNFEGQTISAGNSQTVTITLTPVASPPAGPFSFDITISG